QRRVGRANVVPRPAEPARQNLSFARTIWSVLCERIYDVAGAAAAGADGLVYAKDLCDVLAAVIGGCEGDAADRAYADRLRLTACAARGQQAYEKGPARLSMCHGSRGSKADASAGRDRCGRARLPASKIPDRGLRHWTPGFTFRPLAVYA